MKYFALVLISVLLFSCRYDVASEIFGVDDCATTTVSFKDDVEPLFETYCKACHIDATLGGIDLKTYEGTIDHVNNGSLLGSIKHESGFEAMPQGSAKMSDADILIIETWINECAKDN